MAFIRVFTHTYSRLVPPTIIMSPVRSIASYDKAFVNGEWVSAKSSKTFKVLNPYNGEVLSNVPDMDSIDVQDAIQAAKIAFEDWQFTTGKERSDLLRKWYNLLLKNQKEIASIITSEAGKPLQEALGEVAYGNSFIEWFSEEARRISGEVVSSPVKTKEMILVKQPIGVTALITPWNFPIAMITRKAGAALAAGCTCVIKPAEDTPLTALAVADLAHEAGIPKGVINVVTCDRGNAPAVGKVLCESPDVAGLSFTGSTEVGKLLYQQCASGVKRVGLELGGNAPFIVFSSADVDKAVEGAMASKFRNCGQTCVSANRFLIQDTIFDSFLEKIKSKMQLLVLGSGADSKTNLGPLINETQAKKVDDIVQDAVQKGAKLLYGGKIASHIGERFFEPTLITNVTPEMKCYTEEIFGPVVVCVKFNSEADAIEIANNTRRGLAGYFYSNDLAQVWRVAKHLEVGMVGINEGIISSAEAAFGGIKESGIGREGSHHGIEEFTYVKYMCFGNL
ncbi:Probable methylmalonate-semialdehyde dehydrogenase [acylating], mitochondrial [Gryllus bimaculatus]|nr:Probable methylmalonate-semialdehyde dehydrogenase [acylating], mitochondrial [Gryllus bimaculatus]